MNKKVMVVALFLSGFAILAMATPQYGDTCVAQCDLERDMNMRDLDRERTNRENDCHEGNFAACMAAIQSWYDLEKEEIDRAYDACVEPCFGNWPWWPGIPGW